MKHLPLTAIITVLLLSGCEKNEKAAPKERHTITYEMSATSSSDVSIEIIVFSGGW